MDDRPRSTRPTPRTPAAIEAELRRRLRSELSEARTAAEDAGQAGLDDATLAAIIARAIGTALSLHVQAEHVRGPQASNAGWRSAPGPRGRPRPVPEWPDQERAGKPPLPGRRPFLPGPRPPRPPFAGPRPPRPPYTGPRRGQYEEPDAEAFDNGGPRPPRYPRQSRPPFGSPPSGPRGGRRPGPRGGGGFGPRKPRR